MSSSFIDFNSLEMARSFAQVFQSMDRAEQLEELYVTSVKVIHLSLLIDLRISSSLVLIHVFEK